jgi:hypothetical protein
MVISGLSSKIPKPTGREKANKWLEEIVLQVLDSMEPRISVEIKFISQGQSGTREVPLVEVRMSSKEIAVRLKKNFAQKKKTGHDFEHVLYL